MHFKTKQALVLALLFFVVLAAPARASLPYYNQDLGYTIWLGDGWEEATGNLTRYSSFEDGLSAVNSGWDTVYTLGGTGNVSLLVSRLQGRMVSPAAIAGFNRHVVRQLKRVSVNPPGWSNKAGVNLHKANYDAEKNMLRLEMDALGPSGDKVTSVVYIVYTRGSILKFVGLVPSGDARGVNAVDAAVSTLYLDRGLSQ